MTRRRKLNSFGGRLIDMVRLARGLPVNLHSYMKFVVLRRMRRRTGAKCLIETGTFHGVTSKRCGRVYERVITIELDVRLATNAKAYLKRRKNIEVLQGDATDVLPEVLARDDVRNAVVFIDGHYSGGETARGRVPEPAIAELEILGQHIDRVVGVVVDDFRLFGTESGFPTKTELISTAERIFPHTHFDLKVHADQLLIERRRAG